MKFQILIVDHNDQNIKLFKKAIKQKEYETYFIKNSVEAIEHINHKKIDLIICNQNMIGVSGLEILDQTKQINPHIVRILSSNSLDINLVIQGLNKKIISYYLENPWENEELNKIIEEGLQDKKEAEDKEKIILKYHKMIEDRSQEKNHIKNENMRKFFRNELFIPLCASMNIVEINEKRVNTSSSRVCIVNIGPGGIRFLSGLNFDGDIDALLRFSMEILGLKIEFEGNIAWKESYESEKDIYQYGIEFKIDELYRTELTKVLNEMTVRLNKKIKIDKSSLCTEVNMVRCLRAKL